MTPSRRRIGLAPLSVVALAAVVIVSTLVCPAGAAAACVSHLAGKP